MEYIFLINLHIGQSVFEDFIDLSMLSLVLFFDLELLSNIVKAVLSVHASLLLDLNRVFKALQMAFIIPQALFANLKDRLGDLLLFDGLVADIAGIWVDIVVLGTATVVRLWIQILAVHLQAVLYQLLVPMVTHVTSLLLTLVDLLLGVSPVVLTPITARVEALIAEEALERLLTRVDPLVHLEVRFGVEGSPTDALHACKQITE